MATAATVIGAGLSLVGTIIGVSAARRNTETMKNIQTARINNELNAGRLAGLRERRNAYRRYLASTANATAGAYNSGTGNSSGLSGGIAQFTGTLGNDVTGTTAQESFNNTFATLGKNEAAAKAQYESRMALAQGLSGAGSAVSSAGPALGRMFNVA